MLSRYATIALSFLALVILATAGRAALDVDSAPVAGADTELVVIETRGCLYCSLFHRDVVPVYQGSERAKTVPMRFVDVDALAAETLILASPIDSVPTVLVVRRHAEIGRIPGYVGPENFFHAINRLLSETQD